jgi:hypothetical protein
MVDRTSPVARWRGSEIRDDGHRLIYDCVLEIAPYLVQFSFRFKFWKISILAVLPYPPNSNIESEAIHLATCIWRRYG